MELKRLTQAAIAALLASAGTMAYAQMGGGGATQQPGGGPQGGERSLQQAPGGGSQGGERGMQQAPRGGAGGAGQQPGTRQGVEKQPGGTGPMRQEQMQRGEQPPSMRKGEQKGAQQPRAKQGREQAKEKATGERQRGAGGGVGVRPELSQEQRSTIRQRLSGGPHVSDLGGVSISVGTRLPREVEIRPLPAAVIEIVPQYRGYYYVLVGQQIVIVDPDTLEIVAVLAA